MPPKRYFEAAADDGGAAPDAGPSAAPAAAAAKAPAPATTLFVSRLPFSATSVDLETRFSDIGPLRRAFVVTDPATKASKGVGYVTFAAPEDAARALREMQGTSLDGGSRKMALAWADEKPSLKERKGKQAGADATDGAAAAPAKRPRLSAPTGTPGTHSTAGPSKDPDAVRTLILSGLAACTPAANDKTIYKRCRKIGDVERVVHPALDPSNMSGNAKPSPDIAHVLFRTPNHAATAVDKLHAHTFKGAMLSAVLKKRADGAARLEARMRPEKRQKLEAAQAKARAAAEAEAKAAGRALTFTEVKGGVNQVSRLILRNLPFDITPADLRAVFLPFGPIHSIDVPQKAAPPTRSQIRAQKRAEDSASEDESDAAEESGAAAAQDADKESSAGESSDEEEAKPQPAPAAPVAQSTASTRGRGFAFVWMVSRGDAERALNAINGTPIRHGTAERAAVKSAKGKKGRDAAKLALAQAMEGAQPERQVAVDWALSKKDWEQRAEETDADTDAETGKEDESDDDDDSSADAGSDLDPEAVDELMHRDGSEGEDEDEDDEEEEEMEAPVKPALPAPEEGTTLFIRNLPYQATEPELRDLFRSFGPLRYAKITMDKATQRSRGTGFVCFWQRESADAALRQARLVESEAGPGARGKPAAPAAAGAKNPFTLPSILTADASAPLTASLTLHGRVLSVAPAVAREQAGSLEAAARAAREKGDKRNTHLMREGVPFPNSPLARELNESEKEKRLASFGVRKAQLGANPSLFISKTRLSVRQLPLFATDRILKRLAIYAVRHFGLEARAGERTDLSAEEKGDRTMSAALLGEDGLPKQKRTERQTAVVQSKVVRQQDRLDPLTGNGRSRGYGFLEMRSFIDALKVIRWANARPDAGKLMQTWWLEDLEALVKRLKVAREKQEGNERVETDARLKRLAKRIEELQAGKQVEKAERGGLLQIEFSIENSVVMKKRRERTTAARAGAAVRSRHAAEDAATIAAGGKPAPRPTREEARREAKREAKREAAAADEPRNKKHANWNQKARKSAPVEEVKAKAKASQAVEEHKAKRDGATHIGAQIGRARAKKQKRAGA